VSARKRPPPVAGTAWAGALSVAVLAAAPPCASGAFEVVWPAARTAGLAGAGVGLASGPAAFVLPAPAASADACAPPDTASGARGIAVDRIELSGGELFGLPEARGFLARGTVGSSLGSASLTLGRIGQSLYHETTVGVALARQVREALVVEIGSRLLSIGAEGVPARTTVALDAAVVTRVLGRITVAAAWRNVGGARIGGSPVSTDAAFGAALALDRTSLAASFEVDPKLGTTAAFGCEAAVTEWLRVRAGVALDPGAFGAGIGIGRGATGGRRGGLSAGPVIDLAVTWHPELGGSSFATITFSR
jgi:hypothetical protein